MKATLQLMFHCQSPIWKNCDSWIMGQNNVGQSNCRIQEEVNDELYFWHVDEHQRFL